MDDPREHLLKKEVPGKSYKDYDAISPIKYVNVVTDENVEIEDHNLDTAVYHRRWYVLAIYSLLALTNTVLWNTWGPIARASEAVFGWSDSQVEMMANWGAIMYVVSSAFMSWLTFSKGLRCACIVGSILNAASAGLRCISDDPTTATWLINTAQILNGLAGPVWCAVPPVLSAAWFPAHQRTTATAIAAVSGYIGIAVGFIIGPLMVPDDELTYSNLTNSSTPDIPLTNFHVTRFQSHAAISNDTGFISETRKNIMRLMYVEAAWSVFLLVLMLAYFPAKPPIPPSVSACIGRLNFKSGIKILVRNSQFWLIGMTYFIPQGVNQCWASVLGVILKSHGISQSEAGWLGFYGVIAGTIASLTLARFSDIFSKHMKWFLLTSMVLASVFYLWFTLILNGWAPYNTASIYSSVILGGLFLMCGPPLFFEMTSEITFPVPEAVSVFFLTLLFNLSGAIFLSIQLNPNIGTGWQNWANVGCIVACIPLLIAFKESYKRLAIDEAEQKNS
ncbi:hypothetical protein ScPMuIL_011790 [Solemya velum]